MSGRARWAAWLAAAGGEERRPRSCPAAARTFRSAGRDSRSSNTETARKMSTSPGPGSLRPDRLDKARAHLRSCQRRRVPTCAPPRPATHRPALLSLSALFQGPSRPGTGAFLRLSLQPPPSSVRTRIARADCRTEQRCTSALQVCGADWIDGARPLARIPASPRWRTAPSPCPGAAPSPTPADQAPAPAVRSLRAVLFPGG